MKIERLYTQSNWLGINFIEVEICDNPNKIAGSNFYSEFYRLLGEKYSSRNQLPRDWLEKKRHTAKFVSQFLKKDMKILSYGPGLGVVEEYLITDFNLKPIFGFDFVKPSKLHFVSPDFIQINRIEDLEHCSFDCIYLSQVLYSFDKNEASELLKTLRNFLKADGVLILIDYSVLNLENRISRLIKKVNRIIAKIKREIKRNPKSKIENLEFKQVWGYARNKEFYEFLVTEAGFDTPNFLQSDQQSFFICRK
jgi:SAM-dependent methyltransferase